MLDADEVTVEMSLAGGFDPPSIEIKTGTTVIWHNVEAFDYPIVSGYHQVVADNGSFSSPKVAPGARWSHTFLKPGKFNYHCGIHPHTMIGQIVVTGPPIRDEPDERLVRIVEPDPNNDQSYDYAPDDITIEVGTTVIWRNDGAQDHTVTDDDGAFDSGKMDPGDEFRFTFDDPGVFHYHCKPHPWMEAVVRVHAPGKPPPQDTGDNDEQSANPPPPPPPSSSGGGPTTHYVNIVEGSSTDDWGYDPPSIVVSTGDTVIWENTGSTDHTVTADDGSFDSGMISTGGTYEFTFEEEGEFPYHCEPHPFMVASVTVSDSPKAAGRGEAPGLTIPGGTEEHAPEDAAVGDEQADTEVAADVPFVTLSGKEASLGLVALVASAAAAFLVGQWWGFRVRPSVRQGPTG